MNQKIAIIGYGYWGPNLVRNFTNLANCQVGYVCDRQLEQLDRVKKQYPYIQVTTNYQQVLNDETIDAVAIATPVSTHFALAQQALMAGKHVWVEKPLAATVEEAEQLVGIAKKRNLVLFVDHTFIYTPAVRKIKDLIQNNELGDIYYYDSTRINLGLFQSDVNVLWDLAVHDLAIMNYVIDQQPVAVSATGMSHIAGAPENIAYLTLFFDKPLIAHIHVNWLAPTKIRRTIIGGSKKMVVFDDNEVSEKIKIYDKGILLRDDSESRYQRRIGYRAGDIYAPHLEVTEALESAGQHFISCIKNGTTPYTDGIAGLKIINILTAASQSVKKLGQPVFF